MDVGLAATSRNLVVVPAILSDLEIGTPVQTICQTAKKEDSTLIVIGSRGQNKSKIDKLMGSVAAGVIKKSKCPVLVIPEDVSFTSIDKLTYSTDIKDADPFEIWTTMQLLQPFTPSVDVVHINLKKEGNNKAWEKMENMRAFFQDRSEALDINFFHVPGEKLQEELNEFIETHSTNLLVMYRPHHNFWDRLFHKSATNEQLFIPCP